MFGVNKVEFREKQKAALYRAVRATRLTTKEIAYALGVDSDTFLNWSKGEGTINGASIEALDRFFCAHGYFALIEDIYGDLFRLRRQRADELEKQAAQLRSYSVPAGAAA